MTLRRTAAQLFAAAAFWFGACAALAQDIAELGNRFARVTITEHGAGGYPSIVVDMNGIQLISGTSLITFIKAAYGMPEFRIVDGPGWIYEWNLYDIEAVPPPPELVASDTTRMLRALLADHFKLELRETSREITVLALEFVEATPALQAAEPTLLSLAPGQTEAIAIRRNTAVAGQANFQAALTLPTVASSLTRELKRNVVDMTGLDGLWTVNLDVAPAGGPQLQFEPLLEQLGLRLAERTLALDVLAISHVERPQLDE